MMYEAEITFYEKPENFRDELLQMALYRKTYNGEEIPDWKEKLALGSSEIAINWLKKNVHFKANLYDPGPMMENITGKKLTVKPFIKYLEKKYSKIFSI